MNEGHFLIFVHWMLYLYISLYFSFPCLFTQFLGLQIISFFLWPLLFSVLEFRTLFCPFLVFHSTPRDTNNSQTPQTSPQSSFLGLSGGAVELPSQCQCLSSQIWPSPLPGLAPPDILFPWSSSIDFPWPSCFPIALHWFSTPQRNSVYYHKPSKTLHGGAGRWLWR